MYDVLIIGCGPAGLSAAIYASRGQLKTAIFGNATKGNLYKAHVIGNYFGFPEGPSGPELIEKGIAHAKKFGAEIMENEIVDVQVNADETFTLKTEKQVEYQSKTVIIATGQSYALSGIKNEKELTGKGVSYCAVCDGFFFKGKNIVVVGNGNYAGEEALQLHNYTPKITILSHGKDFEFSEEIKTALEKNGIKTQKTDRIKEIGGTDKVEKIIFTSGEEMPVEGVFLAIGVASALSYAKKLGLEMNGNYLKINENGETNIKGIFGAGDCTGSPSQVATSVGGGCCAALSAIKLIKGVKMYTQYG
jgi:thioredoxin reductase (NADPH)